MSEIIGETSWLHATSADVKVTVSATGPSGCQNFRLSNCPEVLKYTESRALARIVGPITFTVFGPASASKATTAHAVVVPYDLSTWPADNAGLAKAPLSEHLVNSLYVQNRSTALGFHDAINRVLKPEPLSGRHPGIAWSYSIENGAQQDPVRIELSFRLELAGVDYVSPW